MLGVWLVEFDGAGDHGPVVGLLGEGVEVVVDGFEFVGAEDEV